MQVTLYHYVHCPFCVRVRLGLGLLSIPFESVVLPYDDEKTPVDLTGVKMLPIVKIDGNPMNESLDILKKLDTNNLLKFELYEEKKAEIEELLSTLGKDIHNLCMPYWIHTKEFNNESRSYFQTKKEKKRGPFHLLMQKKDEFLNSLMPTLKEIENFIDPYYSQKEITILDIVIASHLWGMYVFPEFQFPPKLHAYLQAIKKQCNFEYHEDFWKSADPM